MKIAIIKYNAGNIRSVDFALRRLGIQPLITDEPEQIISANKVIFPGVGEARNTMAYLQQKNLDRLIVSLKQPVLGICLGMQLMCRHSAEGDTNCLNIFDLPVLKFEETLKVPHMGWNTLHAVKEPLFQLSLESQYVYFVHSYYVPVSGDTMAASDYGIPFSAALRKDNFYAVQFHPEKSGETGRAILENFLNL